ncbi:MAG: sulfatase-like hydrolase/transferase [Holophagales bacterium]|nr:sulfatase-like hydrolase/transferase [Holophagales bacterium]
MASLVFLILCPSPFYDAAGATAAAQAGARESSGAPARPSPPGLLLITLDTTRADALGCYRPKAEEPEPTPVLCALAERGVRYQRALTSAPLTLPAHASLFTGRTPPAHGVRDNATDALDASMPTLAAVLRDHGYSTAAIVASRVLDRRFGLDRGFDSYDDRPPSEQLGQHGYAERTAEEVTGLATSWLAGRPPGRPFFLWVHYYDPHAPYSPPDLPPSAPERQRYQAEVSLCDRQVGILLDAVPDDTLVAVVADHGEALGEHGEPTHGIFLYRSVLEVPLILAGPGVPAGRVVAETVATRRLAATLLHLLAIPAAQPASGSIPGPVLPGLEQGGGGAGQASARGETPDVEAGFDALVYSETLLPATSYGWSSLHAVSGPRHRLVKAPQPELYDFVADPGEKSNLVREERRLARRLERALERHLEASVPRQPAALDAELRRQMSQLGYLSGASGDGEAGSGGEAARKGRLDPKEGMELLARFEEAKALQQRGHPAAAIPILDELVRRNPENVPFLTHLAAARLQAGETEAALTLYRAAVALNPAYEFPRMQLASALIASGNNDEARRQLEKVLELDPRFADASLTLAELAHRQGRRDEERRVLEQASAAGTPSAGILLRLGQLRLEAGEAGAALDAVTRATQLTPRWPLAWLVRAQLHLKLGETEAARTSLEQVLRTSPPGSPQHRQARQLLAGLGH